jgi:amino acid transporter
MKRAVTWKSAFVVSLGGSLLVAVSLGSIAGDIGPVSYLIWSLAGLIGVAQCLMIAELAGMFPHKAGGTATYAHEAFKSKTTIPGVVSNWGYWFGWIPVIAVNLILAAGYMKAFVPNLTDSQVLEIAVGLAICLYLLNYFGLRPGVWSSTAIAVCAVIPLAVIAFAPMFKHSLFHASYVFPIVPLGGAWASGPTWLRIAKWMFVAVWSAYAFEAASTVIAELKDPHKDAPKAMATASAVGMFAYGLVPFMLLAICGPTLLSQDASVAFLPAARAIFGHIGGNVVAVMLITALLLGAQTAIIGCSRTVYEMSRDGLIIKQYGKLNKFGAPVGSMAWDAGMTMILLLIFKTNIVNLVACSNVGYLLPFAILPIAFVVLRITQPNAHRPFKLPSFFVPLAVIIATFNWVLFFVGGFMNGLMVMGTGTAILLTVIPLYLYRRKVQDKQTVAIYSPGESPEEEVDHDGEMSGRRELFRHIPEPSLD